jgi:hypothetical protein
MMGSFAINLLDELHRYLAGHDGAITDRAFRIDSFTISTCGNKVLDTKSSYWQPQNPSLKEVDS